MKPLTMIYIHVIYHFTKLLVIANLFAAFNMLMAKSWFNSFCNLKKWETEQMLKYNYCKRPLISALNKKYLTSLYRLKSTDLKKERLICHRREVTVCLPHWQKSLDFKQYKPIKHFFFMILTDQFSVMTVYLFFHLYFMKKSKSLANTTNI